RLELVVLAFNRLPVVPVDVDGQRFEREARLLGREPAAQRPARIVPVADDQLHTSAPRLPTLSHPAAGPLGLAFIPSLSRVNGRTAEPVPAWRAYGREQREPHP